MALKDGEVDAVVSANRQSCCSREFILIEMGAYFDTILLPYIKKITFAPGWKEGKPERMVTEEEAEHSPRIVKYICLESYEDALSNIEFEELDKKFVVEQKFTEGADEVFVNGDSFIPKAKALEPVFKRRMFAGVEA